MVIPAHTRGAASVDERPSGTSARARELGDEHLRVSSIGCRARIDRVETIHEIAAAAGLAGAIFTAEVTHADPLPNLPSGLSWSNLLNKANGLVAGNAGIDHAGPLSADGRGIRMANAAGLHTNANLSALRRDDFSLHQVEFARRRHFNCFVGGGHVLSSILIIHETRDRALWSDIAGCRAEPVSAARLLNKHGSSCGEKLRSRAISGVRPRLTGPARRAVRPPAEFVRQWRGLLGQWPRSRSCRSGLSRRVWIPRHPPRRRLRACPDP